MIVPQLSQDDLSSLPQMAPRSGGFLGGMFGGGNGKFGVGQAIVAALNGYLAGTRGPSQEVGLGNLKMMNEQRMFQMQQQFEFQRQLALAEAAARLRLQYPDSPLAQSLYQSGVAPGTPGWEAAMKRDVDLKQNPVVNAGPYGPVLYNQVAGAAAAKPLTDADIAKLDNKGGQTPPASGGFLGSPYPNIGPYTRY